MNKIWLHRLSAFAVAFALLVMPAACGESETADTSGASAANSADDGFAFEGGDAASGDAGSGGVSGSASNGASGKTGSASSKSIGQLVGNDESVDPKLTTVTLATMNGAMFAGSGATVYANLFKKKTAEIKSKLGVHLRFLSVSVSDETSILTAIASGNKPSFDILYYGTHFARTLALSGQLLDQKSISAINLNAPQFTQAPAFKEGMTYKGKVYGSLFGAELDYASVTLCNQTLIDNLAGAGKYDMLQIYKSGQWTMEKWREIAKACTPAGNTGIYGAAIGVGNGTILAAYAGGTVSRDAQGKYYPAMLSDAGVQAIELLRVMRDQDKCLRENTGDVESFKNEKTAMINIYMSSAASIVSEVKSGEIVCLPIPKASTQNNHVSMALGNYYMIPKTTKNTALVGKVYQELSTIDMTKYYESIFVNSGMTKENAALAMEKFPAYFRPEFIAGVDATRFQNALVDIYTAQTGSVKAGFDAVRPQFQAAIDDCYNRENNLK